VKAFSDGGSIKKRKDIAKALDTQSKYIGRIFNKPLIDNKKDSHTRLSFLYIV